MYTRAGSDSAVAPVVASVVLTFTRKFSSEHVGQTIPWSLADPPPAARHGGTTQHNSSRRPRCRRRRRRTRRQRRARRERTRSPNVLSLLHGHSPGHAHYPASDGCVCIDSSMGCTSYSGIDVNPRCGCFNIGNGWSCYVYGGPVGCPSATLSSWINGLAYIPCTPPHGHSPHTHAPYMSPLPPRPPPPPPPPPPYSPCLDGVNSGLFWTDGTADGSVPCSFCSTEPIECCDYPEAWANCPLSCGTCPPRDVCTNTCVVSVAPACTWCCYR
jgi:hypothetical protein